MGINGASNAGAKKDMTPDWPAIERDFRAGQLSIKELGRQHTVSDTAIRKHAKKEGWTRDLSGAVRARVRDRLVREGVRANQSANQGEPAGPPSDAAIVDEAAARGVEVVRSHRYDIARLREAAAVLLAELRPAPPQGAPAQRDGTDGILLVPLKVTDRSRVISDLSAAMARLVPLERQAFGLDEDKPQGSQPMTVVWEGMPQPAYD